MAHECPKCTFVADAESIFVGWSSTVKVGKDPKLVGCFTMPNWSGHSNFYLFSCPVCGVDSVDYPHGYTNDGIRNGLLYLICQNCKEVKLLYDKDIYEALGMPAPPSFWEVLKQIWTMRKKLKGSEV
ncbi:MAG: hypothetical protein HYT63_03470 [Candidatus Yanofskybacteria bacterium]|nr:hypothetical protein [Candidatus Yanofskybacteria bacterium]